MTNKQEQKPCLLVLAAQCNAMQWPPPAASASYIYIHMGPSNGHRLVLLALVALAGVDSVTARSSGPDYFDLSNVKLSFTIVMVALVAAFFLLGFFSVCLHRCAGPPLGRGPGDAAGIGIARAAPWRARTTTTTRRRTTRRSLGLDRAVLDAFPTMAYADAKAHRAAAGGGKGGAELECAVCLCEFDDDDTLRLLLPRCAHAFHADCIDAWLASHVTCPVCRAVLFAPDAAPALAAAVPGATTEEHGGGHAAVPVPAAPPRQQPALETSTPASPEQAVAVVVVDAGAAGETEEQRIRREEAAELMRIGSVKRALRSKSGRRPAQFPCSHTTGHSLAAPSPSPSPLDDSERYTLRLPDHVLREVLAAGNLRRSASVQTGGGGGTTRRGFGIGGIARAGTGRSVRLGNSGRWPTMSVLARNFSARLPAWGSVRRGEADAMANGAKLAGGDDGEAVEQCDGGACPLGAHV